MRLVILGLALLATWALGLGLAGIAVPAFHLLAAGGVTCLVVGIARRG